MPLSRDERADATGLPVPQFTQVERTPCFQNRRLPVIEVLVPGIQGPRGEQGPTGEGKPLEVDPLQTYLEARGNI